MRVREREYAIESIFGFFRIFLDPFVSSDFCLSVLNASDTVQDSNTDYFLSYFCNHKHTQVFLDFFLSVFSNYRRFIKVPKEGAPQQGSIEGRASSGFFFWVQSHCC